MPFVVVLHRTTQLGTADNPLILPQQATGFKLKERPKAQGRLEDSYGKPFCSLAPEAMSPISGATRSRRRRLLLPVLRRSGRLILTKN